MVTGLTSHNLSPAVIINSADHNEIEAPIFEFKFELEKRAGTVCGLRIEKYTYICDSESYSLGLQRVRKEQAWVGY